MMMRRGQGYRAPPPPNPMHANRGQHMPPPPPPPPGINVGNITNSNDYASKNARVFVGNLNTFALSKEDVDRIFSPYGLVTGISMHKGYAFVQYNFPGEARKAVTFENGNSYGGQIFDLNIVAEPKKTVVKRNVSPGISDRRSPRQPISVPAPIKRPRQDSNSSMQRSNLVTLSSSGPGHAGGTRSRNSSTSSTAAGRTTAGTKSPASQSSSSATPAVDVLICGVCKMQFKSLHSLAQHKKVPCRLRTSCQCQTNLPKQSQALELDCATCDAQFDSAWALCQHCQKEHSLTIFKTADGTSNSNNTPTESKVVVIDDEEKGDPETSDAVQETDNTSSPEKK